MFMSRLRDADELTGIEVIPRKQSATCLTMTPDITEAGSS
jgi:hypothetical protein